MSSPEMGAITTLDGLAAALRHLRPFYQDDLSWDRFLLVARYLWLVHCGRVRPHPTPIPITSADTTITNTSSSTIADSIIARGKAVRS
jgi:hypothetical protein